MESTLSDIWKIIGFIGVQYGLGRRGSYPYGLMVGFNLFTITLLVILTDIIQTIVLLNLLEYACKKFKWLSRMREKIQNAGSNGEKSLPAKLKQYGSPGLLLISALPYGGGALTGSIVAFSLDMNKMKAFQLIVMGCIVGSVLFYLGFSGAIALFGT